MPPACANACQVPSIELLHYRYETAWTNVLTPRENLHIHLWVWLGSSGHLLAGGMGVEQGHGRSGACHCSLALVGFVHPNLFFITSGPLDM